MYNRAEPKKKREGFFNAFSPGDSDEEEEVTRRTTGLNTRNGNGSVNPLQYHNASATAAMEMSNTQNLSPEALARAKQIGKENYANTVSGIESIAKQQLLAEALSKHYEEANQMLVDLINYSNIQQLSNISRVKVFML